MKSTRMITIAACVVLCLTTAAQAGKPDRGKNRKTTSASASGVGAGTASSALASLSAPLSAPELDAGTASSALALLMSALFLLHERRRRQ